MFDLLLIFLAFASWSAGVVAIITVTIDWIDMRIERNMASRHPFAHGVVTALVTTGVGIIMIGAVISFIWLVVKAFGAN
jgi:divalent metal cation (Fe/Co/Zn/Cd) transporter